MADRYKWPGVYIEEQLATGPIAGVGTSTVAFIGPAKDGPINVPTLVTNWTQFTDTFSDYMTAPLTYLAYAVRSFFDNSGPGAVAYIVRAGSAKAASRNLDDDSGTANRHALRVEAKEAGPNGNNITVAVAHSSLAASVNILKQRAQIQLNTPASLVTMKSAADAAKFASADWVTIEGTTERAQIDRILNDQVFLAAPFSTQHPADAWLRIADITNQRSFRVQNANGLDAGSSVHLSDNAAPNPQEEEAVVAGIAGQWVTLDAPVSKSYALGNADPQPTLASREFDLTIQRAPAQPEPFKGLAMDPRHGSYWRRMITSTLVRVMPPSSQTASTAAPPANRPKVLPAANLLGGLPDTPPPTLTQYEDALATLKAVDDVNLICVPDRPDATLQAKLITHCEELGDRFAILDSERDETPFDPVRPSVLAHRQKLSSKNGFGALYYPWLWISDPAGRTGEEQILIPPSGAVAGIYARTDAGPGVENAPANAEVRNAFDLERALTDAEQGVLNVEGVNVIRMFQGVGRPMVWGARTIAPRDETAWRYVNVRRLLLFIEESLQKGLRPQVFNPNDRGLWKRIERIIRDFLTRVWADGALFGATADEAFYVRIDDELNPEPVRALGQLIIEVGVAPINPAEFIVLRIGLWSGGGTLTP